jgi:hypothetical protein
VACWWYLPSRVNQLDVRMLRVQITSGSPVVGVLTTIDTRFRSMWEVPLEGSHNNKTLQLSNLSTFKVAVTMEVRYYLSRQEY